MFMLRTFPMFMTRTSPACGQRGASDVSIEAARDQFLAHSKGAFMNPISLEQLTVEEAGPLELVSIAGALGCQHVSLFLRTQERPPQWNPIVTEAAFRKELARR